MPASHGLAPASAPRRADADWLKITAGAGTVNVSALAAAPSADLKIGLSLVDATGLVLARGTANGMGATLSVPVVGGDYYIVVDGVGTGDALTAFHLLSDYVHEQNIPDLVVCSPDIGFAKDASAFANLLGVSVCDISPRYAQLLSSNQRIAVVDVQ